MSTEMAQQASSDLFPLTIVTWIGRMLDAGEGEEGRRKVNRQLMEVYAEPLKRYFCGSSWRSLGDPTEIVHGFLASRLDRPDYFEQWRRSGKRLRRWLMTGLNLYLHELWRERQSEKGAECLPESLADPSPDPARGLEEEYDRAYVVSIVQQALGKAERECKDRGLDRHWRVFLAHHYEGKPYAEVAGEIGETPKRVKEMARAPRKRFCKTLEDLLIEDGADPERFDDAIRPLLELDRP